MSLQGHSLGLVVVVVVVVFMGVWGKGVCMLLRRFLMGVYVAVSCLICGCGSVFESDVVGKSRGLLLFSLGVRVFGDVCVFRGS